MATISNLDVYATRDMYAAKAKQYSDQYGLPPGGHNDARDAFRHAFVSAMFAKDYGETIAKFLGDMNELLGFGPREERNMDLYNNSVGRSIGASTNDARSLDQPVRIGGDHNYPPYEYLDEDGLPTGYNIELSQAVARLPEKLKQELDLQMQL